MNMDLAQWGGSRGGVIVQISNEICATRGYNQVVAQRGGHCARTKMQYNDVRISNEICAVGGVQRGGALCNMHVFDASLLIFLTFRAKLAKLSF